MMRNRFSVAEAQRIRKLMDKHRCKRQRVSESALRKKYPSLQDAWDQYQIVLNLVKGQKK
jgi:hypothetical protein